MNFDKPLSYTRVRFLTISEPDRPLTDLYDTEGQGDFSPVRFMARPVVRGHFARLALEQACEGDAVRWLEYLNVDESDPAADDRGNNKKMERWGELRAVRVYMASTQNKVY